MIARGERVGEMDEKDKGEYVQWDCDIFMVTDDY